MQQNGVQRQQRQHKRRFVSACAISDSIYRSADADGAEALAFYPDAPPAPPMAPVKPRATPYTELPAQCFIEPRRGTIRCFTTESHGGLYPRPFMPSPPPYEMMPSGRVAPGGGAVPVDNFNYVYGQEIVAQPYDSPLNRILTRQPTGPWRLVGAAVLDHAHHNAAPKERTMMVYCQTVDSARDRYHYRVVDNNNVPLDLDGGNKVRWKNDGEPLHIPGYPPHYRLHLYNSYQY